MKHSTISSAEIRDSLPDHVGKQRSLCLTKAEPFPYIE
jgi:hypothetical protein